MLIRLAVPADAPALAELAGNTFPLACPPHLSTETVLAFIQEHLSAGRFVEYLRSTWRTTLVVDAHGTLCGYAIIVHGEPADPDVDGAVHTRPTAELHKCYVAVEHHGTGMAADLIAACIDAVRSRGARSMWLATHQDNARAITFYAKHGFTIVGARRLTIGGRQENDVVMECLLTPLSSPDTQPPAIASARPHP